MAAVTSRLSPLIDYLVALFNAAATLGAATPNVTIFDGPVVTELDAPLKLYVGMTDPDNTAIPEPAGDSQQTWAAIGRFGRDEMVTIHCCAEAWSGVDTVQVQRQAVTGITAAVEALMQADTTQFGGLVLFPDPGLTNISAPLLTNTNGALARQTFDLIFRCRIGGF
jgi:hypothetical protein